MLTRDSDPWWVYTTCCLLYNIRTRYNFGFFEIMYISPRFAVMLLAMTLSIIFTVIDICSVTDTLKSALPVGINPFWKLAFVFKLLTDSVILDDFKTALDKLRAFNLSRVEENTGNGWPSHRDMSLHRGTSRREPMSQAKIVATRMEHSEMPDAWIAVKTETTVESFEMGEMSEPSSFGQGQRNL